MLRLLPLFAALMLAFGCKKYPDGGVRALAKNRLYGTWKLKEYYLNGFNFTDTVLVLNFKETFNEGGVYERNYIDSLGTFFSSNGGWDLAAEKSVLKIFPDETYQITSTASVLTTTFTIDRLTKEELWYSFQAGNGKHQLRFTKTP
jgi:hypothetical protein